MGHADAEGRDPLVDRAIRLFEFLGRVQQLRGSPPRSIDAYQRVLWLADVPHHPAVTSARDPSPEDALLTIDRVPRLAPPLPDELVAPWLTGPVDDPLAPPAISETITAEVRERYDRWLVWWQVWAEQELRDRPVRELYGELFSIYVTATGHPEELELVAGVGCLAWTPAGHPPVRRHLLTAPVAIHFDDDSGRLSVVRVESVDAVTVELDMLDPGLTNSPHINEVRAQARLVEAHPLHREEIGSLVRRLVHSVDAGGEYREQDRPPQPSSRAVASFAPAIILRRRSQQGMVDIFRAIVHQLAESGSVPDGVLPLIDPNHRPSDVSSATEGAVVSGRGGRGVGWTEEQRRRASAEQRTEEADTFGGRSRSEPGAIVLVDEQPFLPLPVNDVQLRIIRQVDAKAQTLVQGPPGTGKTHTAAALLSHLLAQGKRVLVTAHTDRALKEVRAKLPAEIKPLSVAIVGSSREDMSDLKVAVERIAVRAAEHDPAAAEVTISECQEEIDRLRDRRAELYRQLIDAREQEVREHEHAGYRGTLAAIAREHQARAALYAWLADYLEVPAGSAPPLPPADLGQWHGYLLDADLIADETEAGQRLPELSAIPEPAAFADLVAAEQSAARADEQYTALREHPAFEAVRRLDADMRVELQRRLHGLAGEADDLARRREAWMNEALLDVRNGRARIWQARGAQVAELIRQSDPLVRQLGPTTEVAVSGPAAALVPLAAGLHEYLRGGGKLRTAPDGSARIGSFSAKPVKVAQPVFDQVRVNGLPPTTVDRLGAFLVWAEAVRVLAALDRAWPEGVPVPAADTLHERLLWHVTELEQLHRVLRLGERLEGEERHLAELGLPLPDWTDLSAVRTYAGLVDAAAAHDAVVAATQPLHQIEQTLADTARWADAAPVVDHALLAVRQRDHDSYAEAYGRLRRLDEVRRTLARRDGIAAQLSSAAPRLRAAIEAEPSTVEWRDRLAGFAEAWAWASTGTWIAAQGTVDANALQASIAELEERIRRQVETLAATRAWSHAVSASRLTGQARANLEQYAYLVRKLGKGTGKYADARRAEIRVAMDRCRPAVPVWIMPIYRIAEQLQVRPDMFDVVIVDEASQAGLEATFLQYLAPKMVVIGDDKQVSPSAVGVDQQQLRDLAGQYLADDPYRAAWQDPQRSLFDEAKMRFSGLLTLTEHRRCVPEIIGFSNRIAYEPDGIRLNPVRQYGADRLDPIRAVFLPDGYATVSANKVNPVEVEAIVETIEKCIADPRYDGLSMGVISLLGAAQAKAIETELLARITPEELVARDLRCGDSADFQGSERDVMFLSMVAAPEPDRRMGVLTRDLFVQRYNVAASRARDQMWLFHSVPLADLGNPEDMRFTLLDYCYDVINRRSSVDEGAVSDVVPEDRLVDPFESLFEQRVCNRLVDRGYTVIPRYVVEPHRLDLVVVGAKTRLAIECDGDTWHGPEAYERDLARQRDLERCGWTFFRIRESAFHVDEPGVLEALWTTLRELDIHPSGWSPPEPDSPPAASHTLTLAPYEEFTGTLVPALDATRPELVAGLRSIVAIEGPVVGHRLHTAYVLASGGQRVGKLIANALNAAIAAAVRDGILVEENPLTAQGLRSRTYRLPDQPSVRVRQLGPRPFEHLPPTELAALLTLAAASTGWEDEESLYRTVLDLVGLSRLTTNVADHLRAVRPLL